MDSSKNTKRKSLRNRNVGRSALLYLGSAVFCAVFGIIYESFSHGVYSPFMIWAFLLPLILGAAPYFTIWAFSGSGKSNAVPCPVAAYSYAFGIATLTCGSIMCGVLEIYGTTSHLSAIYWFAGGVLFVFGLLAYILQQLLSGFVRKGGNS